MAAPATIHTYPQRPPSQSSSNLTSPPPQSTTTPTANNSTFTTLPTRPISQQSSSFRTPATRRTIYDRHPNRSSRSELSRSAFSFLIAESISYHHKRISSISEFEGRLNAQGYLLGSKVLDLLLYRNTPQGSGTGSSASGGGSSTTSSASGSKDAALPVRPLRIVGLLTLLTTKLYPMLFGRPADSLEQSTTNKNEYMIIDNSPVTGLYISVPKEMSQLSVAAWIAGVVEGVCDAAGFGAKVSAHNAGTEMWPGRTVLLVAFEEGVGARDGELERAGVK